MSEWDDDMQEAAEITMRGMMSAGKELEKELEQLKASHKSEILRYARMAAEMAREHSISDYDTGSCADFDLTIDEIIAELEKRMDGGKDGE